MMSAVLVVESVVSAVSQRRLRPITLHVIQNYKALALSERRSPGYPSSSGVAKHATDDVRLVEVPQVITDGSPRVTVEDFNTTFARLVTTHQTNYNVMKLYQFQNFILFVTMYICYYCIMYFLLYAHVQ